MALKDDFEARYTLDRRVALSNPGDRSATTQDDTRVNLAVTDAQALFEAETQAAYDSTNAKHVMVGVMLVEVFLLAQAGTFASTQKGLDFAIARCHAIRDTSSRSRVTPTGTSPYTRTRPDTSAGAIPPPFDVPWETLPTQPGNRRDRQDD